MIALAKRRLVLCGALCALTVTGAAAPAPALPLIEAPPKGAGDALAIFYSGDGGWSVADEAMARELSDHGVGVVGVDSLRYFAAGRSAPEAAEDLVRIASRYSVLWRRPKVAVIGYSFGAGAAPMIVAGTPAAARANIRLIALVSPLAWGSLRFTVGSWMDIPPRGSQPLAPTLAALKPTPILCIYGMADRASACRTFGPGLVRAVPIGGGHHFGGDYRPVGDAILDALG